MKGDAESQEAVYCSQMGEYVPLRVVECNNYKDVSAPSLRGMEELAWVLRTDKSGRQIGFVSPDRWREEKGKHASVLPHDIDD